MRKRLPLPSALALAGLCLAVGGTASGQVLRSPGGREPPREVRLRQGIEPEDVRRMGDLLRAMNLSNLSPQVRKAIKDFVKDRKNLSPEEIQKFASRLQQSHPELRDTQKFEELRKLLQNYQGQGRPSWLPGTPSGGDSKRGNFPTTPPAGMQLPKVDEGSGPTGAAASVGAPPGREGSSPSGAAQSVGGAGDAVIAAPPGRSEFQRRQEQAQAVTGWWEQNIGSLDETPALRKLLIELVTGSGGGTGDGGLGDLFSGKSADGDKSGLGKFAEKIGISNWKLPDFKLGDMDVPTPSGGGSLPSVPAGPSAGGFGSYGGGGGSWLPVVLLGAFTAVALVLWWLWPRIRGQSGESPRPLPGLGPWPVDPRAIADRESLVKAFEYLSVLQCGSGSRTWNHLAIADGLRQAVPTAHDAADPLAHLYAVARYTPAEEPFPDSLISDARRYLCRLAGVKPV